MQAEQTSSRAARRSTTMGGMPLTDMPWWRWRANVRSALHMLSDQTFHQECWAAGHPGYGDVTDAVYRLVEDTWLDNWSADRYVGTIFRDTHEAVAVDAAVLQVLRILHQVGADAPVTAYFQHAGWPEAVQAARAAHLLLAANDGDNPDTPPWSLAELATAQQAV